MTVNTEDDQPPGDASHRPAPYSRDILRLVTALQEREHRALADQLHDGPMQDFTAILLELASLRRHVGGELADQITSIEDHLRTTVGELHLPPAAFRLGHDAQRALETGLAHRVAGLLVARMDTEIDLTERPPGLAQIAVALAGVQLLLIASDPAGPGRHAWVWVRSDAAGLDLRLRVRPAQFEPPDDARRLARLRPVAEPIGFDLLPDPDNAGWSASLHLDPAGAERAGTGPAAGPTRPGGLAD